MQISLYVISHFFSVVVKYSVLKLLNAVKYAFLLANKKLQYIV